MKLFELCNKINLQLEMLEEIKKTLCDFPLDALDDKLQQFTNRETARNIYEYLDTTLTNDPNNIKLLICNLESAARVYDSYQFMHISDKIYFDTMRCFTRFIDECKRKTGKLAFDRAWWTYRQISMSLFRIGELEYELQSYNGEKAISIHIPSNADFIEENVETSLAQANKFFKQHFPEYNGCKFICESWLLSPVLQNLLDENSNIIRFQKRFTLIHTNPLNTEYINWLFMAPSTINYNQLSEQTSLQRNAKQLLLQEGKHIGDGFGILKELPN